MQRTCGLPISSIGRASRLDRLDRRLLHMHPLSERKNKLNIEEIAILPDDPMPRLSKRVRLQVETTAEHVASARRAGKPVILTYGAHLIKNGLSPVVIRMIEEGWVTHLATNGAGSIHDWEFAYQGLSTEDVRANTAVGRFGTWEETGRNINLAIAIGAVDGLGYGYSIGRMISDNGFDIPAKEELRQRIAASILHPALDESLGALADMLYLTSTFDLCAGRMRIEHPFRDYSVQYVSYKHGVPLTVHPGIGYDIIYTHPMNSGGAIGRGAVSDFLSYASGVSKLGNGGMHISVGSAIMSPMIFEKSLSMANNLSIKVTGEPIADYYLTVVDIQDGGDWDWSQGEPPMDNPAYYLRFCKSFYRMGGRLDYICLDNCTFMLGLYQALKDMQ